MNATEQPAPESTLFVMLPDMVDDLMNFITSDSTPNSESCSIAMAYYLIDRRQGKTHAESLQALTQLNYHQIIKNSHERLLR